MLIFRPFKAGDFIEGAGTSGIVKEIQIFTTILNSLDNRRIIVPNSNLLDEAKRIIADILSNDVRVLTDPAPRIGVSELAASSVNLAVWSWVKAEDYLDVMFDLQEVIKGRFDAEGVTIPCPQQGVYIKSQPG